MEYNGTRNTQLQRTLQQTSNSSLITSDYFNVSDEWPVVSALWVVSRVRAMGPSMVSCRENRHGPAKCWPQGRSNAGHSHRPIHVPACRETVSSAPRHRPEQRERRTGCDQRLVGRTKRICLVTNRHLRVGKMETLCCVGVWMVGILCVQTSRVRNIVRRRQRTYRLEVVVPEISAISSTIIMSSSVAEGGGFIPFVFLVV